MNIGRGSSYSIQLIPNDWEEKDWDPVASKLRAGEALPLMDGTVSGGKLVLIFCHPQEGRIRLSADNAESEALLEEVHAALLRGGCNMIFSSHVFCDGGPMYFFDIPAWKAATDLSPFRALETH